MSDSMSRDEIRNRIDARWEALWATINSVAEEHRAQAGAAGYWSVKDLLGHLAYWEAYALGTIQRIANGEPDPDINVEEINTREYAARQDWSWDHAESVLRSTHAELLAALPNLPETLGAADLKRIADDSFDHYDEHIADISAWQARDTGSDA